MALHLNEIKDNVSLKEYLSILNNVITMRQNNDIEGLVNLMGISLDDFISGELIKHRVKDNYLMLEKRFNAYY